MVECPWWLLPHSLEFLLFVKTPLMSRIDLVSKNLLANCFRNFSKKRFKENCYQKNREEIANVTKIAKVWRIFLAVWKDWVTNMAKKARTTNSRKQAAYQYYNSSPCIQQHSCSYNHSQHLYNFLHFCMVHQHNRWCLPIWKNNADICYIKWTNFYKGGSKVN